MTIATELHHVAHLGHDVYEQCPACRAAEMQLPVEWEGR